MAEALKDQIDQGVAKRLAKAATGVDPKADTKPLVTAGRRLKTLELKDRVNLLADALAQSLSGSTKKQLKVVQGLAASGDFDGLTGWPLASFIERHALDQPQAALETMREVTKFFTCEFALRPFLIEHFDLAMSHVLAWTSDSSEHPRRLASEGTRPNLPWAPNVPALIARPEVGVSVLEELRHDPSEYVRRSVANHLNDVAKLNSPLVLDTLARWNKEPATDKRMVRHALRTLVKKGDAGAMEVLGFTSKPKIQVNNFQVAPTLITLGDSLSLEATVTSRAKKSQHMVVDFVVHHVLANGSTSAKVFKWTTLKLDAGETATLSKKRKIATASTRKYHSGFHKVELQIAGKIVAQSGFELPHGS